jgi:hypothetical protein
MILSFFYCIIGFGFDSIDDVIDTSIVASESGTRTVVFEGNVLKGE